MSRSFEGLDEVVHVVTAAQTADQALVGIAATIGDRFALWTNALVLAEDERALVVAIWSATPSFFQPGTDIAAALTEETREIYDTVRSGKLLAGAVRDRRVGLMNDLLEDEGLLSYCLIPLSAGEEGVTAALCLFSAAIDGIGAHDIPFFTGVGKGTEARLVALAREAESALERDHLAAPGRPSVPGETHLMRALRGRREGVSRSSEGIEPVVEAVNAASSAEEALGAIVAHLGDRYSLRAACLMSVDADVATMVAVWTATESFFESRIQISLSLTPHAGAIIDQARKGSVVAAPLTEIHLGMLDDLFDAEGFASFAVIPLVRGDDVRSLIGLLSDRHDALGSDDLAVLGDVGRGVEDRLVPLIAAAEAGWT